MLEKKLAQLDKGLSNSILNHITKGIERETLRVNQAGQISTSIHPAALGSTLTHPHITTDFSEALLELITKPHTATSDVLAELQAVTTFTAQNINQEQLWAVSMPGTIDSEKKIKIAEYGTSCSGVMKKTYRKGLAHRYGKMMQVISGIHYNFSVSESVMKTLHADAGDISFTEFKNQAYFGLLRNYFRYYCILPYLFGASPACAKQSVSGDVGYVSPWHNGYLSEYATSLRMSDLGYTSDAQKSLKVSYNDLHCYSKDILKATQTPFSLFTDIGIQDEIGQYKQLNDCIIQIENEYYSPIRPKRVVGRCERPVYAMNQKGVDYVEVRILDVNPFSPEGIDQTQVMFMDLFLLFCLFQESPHMTQNEKAQFEANFDQVVTEGRNPNLMIHQDGNQVRFTDFALEVLNELLSFAKSLSAVGFEQVVKAQIAKIENVKYTPSGIMVEHMMTKKLSHDAYSLQLTQMHHETLMSNIINADTLNKFEQLAAQSLIDTKTLEDTGPCSFKDYIAHYFAQTL